MLIPQMEQDQNNKQSHPPRTSEQGVSGFGGQGMQRPLGGEDNGLGRQHGSGGGGQGFSFPPSRANHDQPIFGQRLQDVQSFNKPSENQGFSRMREGPGTGFFRHEESQLGQVRAQGPGSGVLGGLWASSGRAVRGGDASKIMQYAKIIDFA